MPDKIRLTHVAAAFGIFIALLALDLFAVELWRYPDLAHFHGPVPGGDYRNFWAPARLIWFGEAYGAYDPMVLTPMMRTFMDLQPHAYFSPLYYPPTYLLFLAPFGLLEFFPSFVTFFVCGLALFLATLWVITRRLWFVLLMLAFAGIWINLVTGQNGLFTSSLFGLGFVLLQTNPVAAGICFGLLTFKPHLGLLIPVALIAARRWQVILVAALTALAMFVAAGALFGPDIWTWGASGMFTASLNLSQSPRLLLRIPSAFSLLRLSGVAPGSAMLLHLGFVMALVVLVWGIWRHSRNNNLNAAATACAALLAAPFLYDYDMALMGIAIAFLALEIARTGWWWGERVVLPLAMTWPIALGWIALFYGAQLGLLGPVLLLLVALRRILKEVAVARSPAPALNKSA